MRILKTLVPPIVLGSYITFVLNKKPWWEVSSLQMSSPTPGVSSGRYFTFTHSLLNSFPLVLVILVTWNVLVLKENNLNKKNWAFPGTGLHQAEGRMLITSPLRHLTHHYLSNVGQDKLWEKTNCGKRQTVGQDRFKTETVVSLIVCLVRTRQTRSATPPGLRWCHWWMGKPVTS